MDAYLSEEALQAFRALALLNRSCLSGFLLGHKRGHRFYIERIFPSQDDFFSSPQHYFKLNSAFQDGILGFYSTSTDPRKMKKILAPFAFGKMFLKLGAKGRKTAAFRAFLIDSAEGFILKPLRIVRPAKRTP